MRVRIQWMLSIALAIVLVAQVPASATAPDNPASPPTGSSQPTNKACGVKPLSDPPLWEQSLPLATESSALSASDPGCVREVARSASSVVWQNPNRTLSTRMFSSPVNYQAPDGSWQAIDTRLVPDGKGGTINKAGPFSVDLASSAADPSLVRMGVGDASLSFGFDGALPSGGSGANLRPAAVSGSVSGDAQDTVTYADALANVDVRFQVLAQELKEAIVLNRPLDTDVSPQFAFTVAMSGMSARTEDDGTIQFVDSKSSKVLFTIPQGLAVDASGDMSEQRLPATTAVSVSLVARADASVATLVESVDPAWLADPARVYPVTIDPSLTMGGSGDAYISQANTSLDCTGSCQLASGRYYDWAGYLFGSVRSLIQYPVSELDGMSILSATWHGDVVTVGGTAPVTTTLHPISSSWSPTSVNWLTQPSVRTDTATISSTAAGWKTTDITAWMQAWTTPASPWDQDGIRLEGASGTLIDIYGSQDPIAPTYIDANFDVYPTLSNFTAGGRYQSGTVNDSTPQLSAQITDTDSAGGLTGAFQLWNSTHTTMLQSGIGSSVASGQNTIWSVPTGLADGAYEWRVDGSDGSATSAWSAWQTLTVDTAPPNAPTITVSGVTLNTWVTAGGASVGPHFTGSGSTDVDGFFWGMDVGNNPTNWVPATANAADVTQAMTWGWHDIAVETVDNAGNISSLSHFTFGWGSGGFTTPQHDFSTQQQVPVQVDAPLTYTGVRLEWRHGDTEGWSAVPTSDISPSGLTWPSPLTAGTYFASSPTLLWNAASTAGFEDGSLELRAAFYPSSGGPTYITDAPSIPNIEVDQINGGSASASAGPGTVNLMNGNLELSASDVSLAGGVVSRTFDSRDQSTNDGVFGPGWKSNIATGFSSLVENQATLTGPSVVVYAGTRETDFTQLTSTAYPYTYAAEDGSDEYTLTKTSASDFSLTLLSGQTYVFEHQSSTTPANRYEPTTVTNTVTHVSTQVSWSSTGVTVPTTIVGPTPPGLFTGSYSCEAPPTGTSLTNEGCTTLTLVYATTTTATGTGSSQWGNYAGQLKSVNYTAWNPDLGTPAMQTVSVASYLYDNSGMLRSEWDPRVSPPLKTTYTYDAYGHVSDVWPAGVNAYHLTYAPLAGPPAESASTGRLSTVSQVVPTYLGSQTPITTFVYGIPLTVASGGAYNMDSSTVASWGQLDDPKYATAVFPPDEIPSGSPPSAYTRATIYYMDAEEMTVNVAEPGGKIGTSEYDTVGNQIRSLSPADRAEAIATGTTTAAHADESRLIDSQTIYDGSDMNVTDTLGPAHLVQLPGGASVLARQHVHNAYDENVPFDLIPKEPFDLLTTQTEGAAPVDGSAEQDVRTVQDKYDLPGDEDGWELGTPLQSIVDPTGLNLATTSTYDITTGNLITHIQPEHPSGTDAHETDYVYYTASTNSLDAACGNKPDWVNRLCRRGPAAQPGTITSALPDIPTSYVSAYNMYGEPEQSTDWDLAATPSPVLLRTSDLGYDTAGRRISQTMSSAVGTAVDTMTMSYDVNTGQPYQTIDAAASLTITRTYNAVGLLSTYQDADSYTTTFSHDQFGDVHSAAGVKGTTTYVYDTSVDPRGLLTSLTDTGITGSWGTTYDDNGNPRTETFPGGNFSSTYSYDETGEPVSLTYTGTPGTLWPSFADGYNIHGERVSDGAPLGGDTYDYDADGRLVTADQPGLLGCTERTYGFDADTNRTSLQTVSSSLFGSCPPSGSGVTVSHTYDAADRINDTGTSYDALGRTLTIPATDAPSGYATNLSYYSNDLVHTTVANGTTTTFSLDPDLRDHTWSDGTNTHTNHYAGDDSAPTWTAENASGTSWTRNVGANGLAATVDQSGVVQLQLANLHGDIFSTVTPTETDWVNGLFANGTVTYTATDEYGVPETTVGQPVGNRYDYLGTQQVQRDTNSGLQLMGARVYNPTTGRFLQMDPVESGSANAYDYSFGDPENNADPTGDAAITGHLHQGAWGPWTRTSVQTIQFLDLESMDNIDVPVGGGGAEYDQRMVAWFQWNWTYSAPYTSCGSPLTRKPMCVPQLKAGSMIHFFTYYWVVETEFRVVPIGILGDGEPVILPGTHVIPAANQYAVYPQGGFACPAYENGTMSQIAAQERWFFAFFLSNGLGLGCVVQ